MKYLAILAAAATLLLSGCATTIRSDVTAFNDWPADLTDKSYVFAAPAPAEDTLEYRSYQVLVSNELAKLGFHQAPDAGQAKLLVGMHFVTVDQPFRILTADDPFWYGPGFHRFGYYPWGYRPYFYDPVRYGSLQVQEDVKHQYERKLNVTINTTSGRKLFDATVTNTSMVQATPHVMPALVQSAFAGFPGRSGVPYRMDIQIDPKTEQSAPAAAPPAKVAGEQPATRVN